MKTELLINISKILGVAGFALTIFYLLYKQLLAKALIKNMTQKQSFIFLMTFMVLVSVVILSMYSLSRNEQPANKKKTDYSTESINQMRFLISDLTGKYTAIEAMYADILKTDKMLQKHFNTKPIDHYKQKEMLEWIKHKQNFHSNTYKLDNLWKSHITDEVISNFTCIEDIQALNKTFIPAYHNQVKDYYELMHHFVSIPQSGWLNDMSELLSIEKQVLKSSMAFIYYGIWDITIDLPKETKVVFEEQLPYFTLYKEKIPQSKEETTNLIESYFHEQEQLTKDLSEILGREKLDIELYTQKVKKINASQEQLDSIQIKIEKGKNNIAKKFAVKQDDEPEIIWGKALRFLTVQLYEDAVNAFNIYGEKMEGADSYVTAAIRFTNNIPKTNINYGALVIGFEPGKSHSSLKAGDIIIETEGSETLNANIYAELSKRYKGKDKKLKIIRFNSDIDWEILNIVSKKDDCLVGVLGLNEGEL